MTGLSISDDLIFASKIAATARAKGFAVVSARSGQAALIAATQAPPNAVIVDLNNPGLKIGELIEGLREACPAMPRLIAYGSHVDAESLKAAKQAGCDHVMARSQFVKQLETHLARWCGQEPLPDEGE